MVGSDAGRRYFEFRPMPGRIALMVAGVLAAYLAAKELLKRRVFTRFDL